MNLKCSLPLLITALAVPLASHGDDPESIAVIGTGDMGNSLGPRLAQAGYRIVYGSRDPSRTVVQDLLRQTGENATATTQAEAAQAADIVLLTVPWPAMEQVAQSLGNLDGKVVIDVSFPEEQGPDGYPRSMVETSSAELIQQWNPGARVVKWSLPSAFLIDDPLAYGHPPANWIAADDKSAKELVARMAHEIGQDPIDAGPLHMSRAVEAQALLFMVPLYQRRPEHWENFVGRSDHWAKIWGDDLSEPVADAENLARFPRQERELKECSDK